MWPSIWSAPPPKKVYPKVGDVWSNGVHDYKIALMTPSMAYYLDASGFEIAFCTLDKDGSANALEVGWTLKSGVGAAPSAVEQPCKLDTCRRLCWSDAKSCWWCGTPT